MEDKSLIENNNEDEIMDVENIYSDIKEKILIARSKMLKHIDTTKTEVYWYVGMVGSADRIELVSFSRTN